MATGDGELKDARDWCEKARQLLGLRKGRKHGNRMDEALENIQRDLRLAQENINRIQDERARESGQKRWERYAARFVEISKLARKAAESDVNEMAQIVSEQLVLLRFEMQQNFYGDSEEVRREIQAAKDMMSKHAERYKLRYEGMLEGAEKQRRALLALNRPQQPDAYEKPVAEAIGRAKALAREERWSEAIGELVAAEEQHKLQLKKANDDRAEALRGARDKPVYESELQAVRTRLARIAELPGTREVHQKLSTAADQIAQAAGQSTPWRKAFDMLRGLESLLARAEQGSEEFEKGADGALDGLLGRAREAVKDEEALLGLAQPQVIQQRRAAITAALKKHDAPMPQTAQAKIELGEVIRLATEATRVARLDEQKYKDDIGAVSGLIDELQGRTPLDVFQPLLAAFRQAGAEFAAQRYADAARTLAALKLQAEQVKLRVDPEHLRWTQLLQEIEKDFLPSLLKATQQSHQALQGAATRYAAFLGARDFTAAVQHDYAAAVRVGTQLKDAVGADDNTGWRKVLKDLAALSDLRESARQALQRVRARIGELEQQGGDGGDFSARLNRLAQAWEREHEKTTDRVALGLALTTLTEGCDELFGEVDGVIKTPDRLEGSQQSATAKKNAAEFQQLKSQVEALIRWLGQEYPGETGPFTLRLGTAEGELLAKPLEAMAAARQLALDVQARIDEKARAVERLRNEAIQLAKVYFEKIKDGRGNNQRIAKAFDPVTHQVQGLLGLADSTVLAVVQDAKNQLAAFQGPWQQFLDQINPVIAKLKSLTEKLESKEFKSRAPQRHALLEARLNQEIPGRCGDDPAQALAKVLTPFEQEVDKAIEAATEAGRALERIKLLAGTLEGEAGKLEASPQLMADFKARIKASRTPAEGQEQAAEEELKRLKLLIEAANQNPELAAGLEQGVRQREFEAEQARNDWEAQAELFQLREHKAASDQHSRVAKLLHLSTRNEVLYSEMETAFSDAKSFAKSQEYERALARLADARRLARQYADNPDGAQISAKKNLSKVVERWRAAAAGFVREMNTLVDGVHRKCLDDPAYTDRADAIVAPLRSLAVAFDAGAFDAAVGRIEKAKELGERRAAKEEALRPLRRFQSVLAADPVVPMLADSPFATVSTKALREAVRDLEVNLLRA